MEEMFIVIGSGRFVRAKTAKDAILVAQDSHSLALFVHKNPVENNFSYSVLYDARESSTHLRESFCPNHIMYSLDLNQRLTGWGTSLVKEGSQTLRPANSSSCYLGRIVPTRGRSASLV